jgi:hypothetical protein
MGLRNFSWVIADEIEAAHSWQESCSKKHSHGPSISYKVLPMGLNGPAKFS